MKKAINDFSNSLRSIFNWLIRKKWQFVFVLSFTSCSVDNQINKDDYLAVSKGFSGSFYDKLDTLSAQYDGSIYTRSLMKGFTEVDNINYAKPIQISINKTELYLSFEDINKKQYVLKFYGKRRKKRFVFYTNYKTVSFPILFISKEVEKFEINFPNENEIVFENKSESQGMFLIFGAGISSKSDYKFKLIRNE